MRLIKALTVVVVIVGLLTIPAAVTANCPDTNYNQCPGHNASWIFVGSSCQLESTCPSGKGCNLYVYTDGFWNFCLCTRGCTCDYG